MKDTFDFRNWITENNVGPYSKMKSNKKLINENIKTSKGSGNVSATIDVNDPDYLEKLVYGTNVSAMPSGNYPSEYVITGPQDVIMQLLSDLGYEEGDYELSENIEEISTKDTMKEAQSETEFYDRAWGLVGNQLKDVIDTLRDDGFEDEDILDLMRTAVEMYDQAFGENKLKESSNKQKLIKKVIASLTDAGLTNQDYTISLQGPTVIFTQSGKEKFKNDIILRAELMDLGVEIM